jgi:uncharacterized membrane protein
MMPVQELELRISKFLRYGVLCSGALMLAGLFLDFKSDPFSGLRTYQVVPLTDQIVASNYLAYAGLASLILLPILRVFLTGAIFLFTKERKLAAIAGVVLFCLLFSLVMGIEL